MARRDTVRAEVYDEFLTEVQILLSEDEIITLCNSQVDWINTEFIEHLK